jgi:hypothetical protein
VDDPPGGPGGGDENLDIAHGIDGWRAHLAKAQHAYRDEAETLVATQPERQPGDDLWGDRLVDAAVAYAAAQPAERDDELGRYFWPRITEATGTDPADLRGRLARARHPEQANGHPAGLPPPPARQPATARHPGLVRALPPYRPFPVVTLPSPLDRLMTEGATAIGCDPAFVALPVLAVAASAVGNSRTIRLKRGWDEPSIVWSAIVADSGALKSPAYALVINPLARLQRRLLEEYKAAVARYDEELQDWKDRKKEFDKGEGDDPGEKPEPSVYERVFVSDITIEKLSEVLEDNPRGVLVARDELSA